MERLRQLLRCSRGDILMEYVILNVFIMVPLVVAGERLFDPAGAASGDLGFFGEQFVGWMQRMLGGVSLPIP